ncbi:MAG: SGNH/GDSL hydrolase family protein [Ruminococcaceae bacterium]|nr:SGNH/GDSL hydrolase family protein [Oscillospiraceae bacterium]
MKKRILITVCALLVLALVLGLCQAVLMPKYRENPEGALIGEYYAEAGEHDVLFVGDCEVYESIIPAVLWEEYGISSYVRGSGQQLVWHSYYLLREMLEKETPKAVVFNVLALKYGEPQSEAFNRMTLDGMQWSSSKVQAIRASMTEDEQFLDYVFPLLRFHSRITELKGEDFRYAFSEPPAVSHSGYLMQTGVAPMSAELADIEGARLSDYTLPKTAMDYLERMRLLCEEKGAELILMKAPTNSWAYWWYEEWEEQIVSYAEQNGLRYYNFIPLCGEIGIDWSRDTYDGGVHLNVYGAEKLTSYFGEILQSEHGIADRRADTELSERWQGRVERYHTDKENREGEK